jgi:prevent-host-death family protein
MTSTTLSSREFNQDTSRAKRASMKGPVFITDRGKPAHVLMSIEDYRKLIGHGATIVDLLSADGADAIDFDPPRAADDLFRPADLS